MGSKFPCLHVLSSMTWTWTMSMLVLERHGLELTVRREGLVAPFLTSHPSPCTSRCVFYLPGHHLLLPSICLLVQLPPLFLYLSVLYTITYHAPCASPVVPSIYLVLPPTLSVCILWHTPTTMQTHPAPCPPQSSAQPPVAHNAP